MPFRFLLAPVETAGNHRGPKYFTWRGSQGIDGYWSLKDFGHTSEIALVGTTIPIRRADVLEMPVTWSSKDRDRVSGYLRSAGIESEWVAESDTWREALQRLAGLTQVYQSSIDDPHSTLLLQDPSAWMGRVIHFGLNALLPLDWQIYAREQEELKRKIIEPLRVRWERERPRFDWRSALRQMALMPLSILMGALPATDTFTTGTDAALTSYSSNWSLVNGNFQVLAASDDFHSNTGGAETMARWNADVPNADQYAQVKISAASGPGLAGPACRCSSSAHTGYGFYVDVAASYLFKEVTGAWTQLGSNGASFALNDVARLEINSTTLTPKKNGATLSPPGAQTDSSISAANYLGICGYDNLSTGRGDDWEGGNLGGSVAVNQVTEIDVSQAITSRKQKAVNQITETDSAQAVTHQKIKAVAQATETDLAQPITRQTSAQYIAVNQVSEFNAPYRIYLRKSTGNTLPASASSVSSGDHIDEAWVNPGNVVADDGTNAAITAATFDSPDQSQLLVVKFNLSALVPAGAMILGVLVTLNAWYANGAVSLDLLQLLDTSGNPTGTNQAATPVALTTSTSNTVTNGGAADKWGLSLTDVWVKDADFGVAIGMLATGANADVFVDAVWINVYYTDPLSMAVGQVTETDTAQPISKVKIRAVAQVLETDLAQPITRQIPAQYVTVNQASETDNAQAISRQKIRAVGQVSETDLAQAIVGRKQKAVGQASETGTAQAISRQKARAIGQVSETDLAQAIVGRKQKAVGQVAETDTTQAISSRKIHAVLQVLELDAAQAISSVSGILIQQVEETDLAQMLFPLKRVAVAQVVEIDLVQAIVSRKQKAVGQISETDVAQAIVGRKQKAAGQASETDETQSFARIKYHALAQAFETDQAMTIEFAGAVFFGLATLSDSLIDVASLTDARIDVASVSNFLYEDAETELEP